MSDLTYEYEAALAEIPKTHPRDVPDTIRFVSETCLEVLLEFIVQDGYSREELVTTLRETANLVDALDKREQGARLS